MIRLLLNLKLKIMSQKNPTTDKIVVVLKWVAWVATALISFLSGTQI